MVLKFCSESWLNEWRHFCSLLVFTLYNSPYPRQFHFTRDLRRTKTDCWRDILGEKASCFLQGVFVHINMALVITVKAYYRLVSRRTSCLVGDLCRSMIPPLVTSSRLLMIFMRWIMKIDEHDILVSYDVSSLFTNVPVDETIEKAFKGDWCELRALLEVATKNQLFQFEGNL